MQTPSPITFEQANSIFDTFNTMNDGKPLFGRSKSRSNVESILIKPIPFNLDTSETQSFSYPPHTTNSHTYVVLQRVVKSPPLTCLLTDSEDDDDIQDFSQDDHIFSSISASHVPIQPLLFKHNKETEYIFHAKVFCLGCSTTYYCCNAKPTLMPLKEFEREIKHLDCHKFVMEFEPIDESDEEMCEVHWKIESIPEQDLISTDCRFSNTYFPTQQQNINMYPICPDCPPDTRIRIYTASSHSQHCNCVSLSLDQ